MNRELPKIKLVQNTSYASLLAQGFDTIHETFNLCIPESVQDRLAAAKAECLACHGASDAPKMEINFGGEVFQISGRGAGRAVWFLQNKDMRIKIRSPLMQWPVTVEYTSEGLWHSGYRELHNRAVKILTKEFKISGEGIEISDKKTWCRLTCAHYAFDFYAPKFTGEMVSSIFDRFVLPSGVKKRAIGVGTIIETVTIGSKSTLEVQIYDKGKEIKEVSGKEWMIKIWEREGYFPSDDFKEKDVWRVELRFASEYLRNRAILTMDDFLKNASVLIGEALFTRRLVEKSTTDENRWRWPMHPIWTMAYEASGRIREFLPLERIMTMRGNTLYRMLCKQVAGLVRNLCELNVGEYSEEDARAILMAVLKDAEDDPEHLMKCQRAAEKYRFVDCRIED